jgi:RNA polymerase sigma-70 factor (ECF subfamily)
MQDDELILRFKSTQNMELIGVLYKKYQALVLGVCLKYLKNIEDANDASMEIFEKLHLDIVKHEITYFKSWLHKVACNHCLMKLRKKNINIEYKEEIELEYSNDDRFAVLQNPVNYNENELLKLDICIEKLKEKQKKTIQMFYVNEQSYKEIQTETGWTFNDVKSLIQNGKLNLKKCIENN